MQKITVLLADDHQFVREGFRSLLSGEDDIVVVGEAENGRQAVDLVKKLFPDVALLDISMPLLNGIEATRLICSAAPQTKVIILTSHTEEAYITSSKEAGAIGFLSKQSSADKVCGAIRLAKKGSPFFHPARTASDRLRLSNHGNGTGNRLSPRELDVLQLIAEGRSNKQAAAELCVSFKTVDKHRQHLMCKLDIHNTAGLTRYALAEGIIECHVAVKVI